MAKRKSSNPLKKTNWANYKATQSRSGWRTRAKKYGLNLDDVPTRSEIQEWLEAQDPIRCYLSGSFISAEVMEIDHKIPLVRGGGLSLDNCGITSRWYNNTKGQMTEEEFKQLLKVINKWEDGGKALLQRLSNSNNIYRRKR